MSHLDMIVSAMDFQPDRRQKGAATYDSIKLSTLGVFVTGPCGEKIS